LQQIKNVDVYLSKQKNKNKMNGQLIYKLAEELKNINLFDAEFSKLSKQQKISFARLVKMGDSEQLALATAIIQKNQDNSMYELAYYS